MFNIGIKCELYIFECLINNFLDITRQTDTWTPLFIMASVDNNNEIQKFFEQYNYFGYNSENIWFFIQEQPKSEDNLQNSFEECFHLIIFLS